MKSVSLQLKNSFIFLCLSACLIYYFSPKYNSEIFNYIVFFLFSIEIILYFKLKRKENFWDFDSIFLSVFTISAFAYPLLIFDESEPFLPFFHLEYNVNDISKAVSLSFVAASFYMLGSLYKKKYTKQNNDRKEISINKLVICILLFTFLFVLLGGIDYYKALYDKRVEASTSGLLLQVQALLQAMLMSAIGIEFYNIGIRKRKINRLLLGNIVFIVLIMLYAGNRTLVMQLILPFSFYVTYYFIRISKIKFLFIIIGGAILLTTVGLFRNGKEVDTENLEALTLMRDIVIPARNNYLVFEVVEKEGHTLGYSMSGGIIGVIPSLERVLKLVGLESDKIGSAILFTKYSLGDNPSFGVGTMLQADAYLSFGFIGVIIVFFSIGYIADYCYQLLKNKNVYYFVFYGTLMAHAVFWVRAEAFYPLRIIIWSLIVTFLTKNMQWKKK